MKSPSKYHLMGYSSYHSWAWFLTFVPPIFFYSPSFLVENWLYVIFHVKTCHQTCIMCSSIMSNASRMIPLYSSKSSCVWKIYTLLEGIYCYSESIVRKSKVRFKNEKKVLWTYHLKSKFWNSMIQLTKRTRKYHLPKAKLNSQSKLRQDQPVYRRVMRGCVSDCKIAHHPDTFAVYFTNSRFPLPIGFL